jgi:hypothetical protein
LRRRDPAVKFAAMRLALRFLVLLSVAVSSAVAGDIGFVRVWPGWKDAEAFDSISEYFTGREEHAHRVVLRTHPDVRAGFYYLVRVANSDGPVSGARFALHVIAPTSPDAKTYTFSTTVPKGSTVYQLGLTGAEWPDRKAHPVAWELELQSGDGRVLASEKSFLWELPAK